ncbi:MAG TPA: phospholipase D-like domain-containing protein [Verrucomicrobiae bacterium]|nr:phospholipase D-like domain-containing protein [Verrucomicrobiae bacterium]
MQTVFPTRLWLLCMLLAGLVMESHAVEKLIRRPIVTDYGVSDPAFQETISHHLHDPLVAGNKITELVNGVEIFPEMLRAIGQATNTITFENFIWRSGVLSGEFIEVLTERARAGVKIHCIVDSFGAFNFDHADRKRLRAAGVELEIFNQIYPWNFWRWNHRTHRKLLVIDGKVGFIGGICLADEWMGDATQHDHWRDTEFRVEGPVVGQMQGAFMDNWMRCTSRVLHGEEYFPTLEPVGDSLAQCFKSGPRDGAENARLLYLYSIAAARRSIRLSHSYFVPDNLAIEMLVAAARRGVKIEVITPGIIDWNIVRRAARSRWDRLMEAGVQFYEFEPARYHCKVMVVDESWVTFGSINFDDRSFRINGEANMNVYDPVFAARQVQLFEADKALSTRISRREFRKRPWYIRAVENFWGFFRGTL